MCGPVAVPIVMAVMAIGTSLYQANQNKIAVERQMRENQKQTNQAASSAMEDRIKAAREARAAARAAAAESGVSGNSADAVLSDIQFQASRDVSRIEKNRQNGFSESTMQAKGRFNEINGQLASSVASSAASAASSASSYYGSKGGA